MSDFDPEKIARNLVAIAMASQWPDGNDILLGEQMLEAKDAILALSERNAALDEALRYYAEVFCELGPYTEACSKLSDNDCSGCKARRALQQRDQNDVT